MAPHSEMRPNIQHLLLKVLKRPLLIIKSSTHGKRKKKNKDWEMKKAKMICCKWDHGVPSTPMWIININISLKIIMGVLLKEPLALHCSKLIINVCSLNKKSHFWTYNLQVKAHVGCISSHTYCEMHLKIKAFALRSMVYCQLYYEWQDCWGWGWVWSDTHVGAQLTATVKWSL